jgi:hypothetical protein
MDNQQNLGGMNGGAQAPAQGASVMEPKNIFGAKSYWGASFVIIILLAIFVLFFSKSAVGMGGVFAVVLTVIQAFLVALAFSFGAKMTKVEGRSYDKAVFINTALMLFNTIFAMFGGGILIALVQFVLAIIIGVQLIKKVYVITTKQSWFVLLWSFLILVIFAVVFGFIAGVLATSLKVAQMKAGSQIPTTSTQIEQ